MTDDLPTDRTTAQDVVNSAVDRKGAAWVRENISQVLGPLRIMGIDADREDVTGPYIEDGRYVVERPRETRTPEAVAETALLDCSLGPQVKASLEAGYDVLAGTAVGELADPFGRELATYFDPEP